MTSKQVKGLLKQYLKQLQYTKLCKTVLEQARSDMTSLRAVDYTQPRVQGGKISSPVENAILKNEARIARREQDYAEACSRLYALEDWIAERLPRLDAEEKGMVVKRYLQGVPVDVISKTMCYSKHTIENRLTAAYKKMAD